MASWSSRNWILQLQDMLLTIDLVEAYLRDHSAETFLNDHKAITTACYNLRLIGEAACAIPREIRDCHKDVPWVHLRNLRSPVSNMHFRENPRILWVTCYGRIFPTATKLAAVLKAVSLTADNAAGA